jgi:phosphomannomutase
VPDLRFGYEEALGYCTDPAAVRDKDGVSAALLMADLAAQVKSEGRSLLDVLDDIARDHGVHATDQLAIRVDDLSLISTTMTRLRSRPPAMLGARRITAVDDLEHGDGGLPPTEGLRFRLEGDARVVVRPSGTEPKLKCYIEVVSVVSGDDVDSARRSARGSLDRIKNDLAAALGMGAGT